MQPEYTSYTASAHNKISCVQCHIKPGTVNMLTHKMKSLKEVYYHVTGVPKQIVQTEEEAVSNQNCLQCHSKNRLVTASGDLKVNHKGHIEQGIPCITCHSGVVHAKMASRGINTEDVRGDWTKASVQKLTEEKYLRPNMGTCIDCHDKVNKGEKPWKDPAYSVPPNSEETEKKLEETQTASASAKTETTTASATETKTETTAQAATTEAAVTTAHDENTQKIILQAIGKEKTDVKLSMECTTCHKRTIVPKSHKNMDWNNNHGTTAIQKLDTCVNCHQDSKWVREIPKEDIISLLKMGNQKVKYTPNANLAKVQARTNKFCSACHTDRPASHGHSDQWLTAHSAKAKTADQKAGCFVCHDNQKPAQNSTTPKAPTDVYCQYCHRTGFKDDSKN